MNTDSKKHDTPTDANNVLAVRLSKSDIEGKIDVYNELLDFLQGGHEGYSEDGFRMVNAVEKEITNLLNKANRLLKKADR